MALISGRSMHDIDRLFAPLALPVAGQHGIERRDADGIDPPPRGRRSKASSAPPRKLVAAHRRASGLVLEDKGMTLALHYRRAPAARRTLAEREMRALAAVAGRRTSRCSRARSWSRSSPAASDKGTAIAEFMAEAPFAGRMPVFVGDDLTDEHGFALVNRLGGHSVKVGAGRDATRAGACPTPRRCAAWPAMRCVEHRARRARPRR